MPPDWKVRLCPLAKLLAHLEWCWSWRASRLDTLSRSIRHFSTCITLIMMGPKIWSFFLSFHCETTCRVFMLVQARLHEACGDYFHLAIPSVYLVDIANGLLYPSIEDRLEPKVLKTFTFIPSWTVLVLVCLQRFCSRPHPWCPPLDDTCPILELWSWWNIQSLDCLHAQHKGFKFLPTLRLFFRADHVESLSTLLRVNHSKLLARYCTFNLHGCRIHFTAMLTNIEFIDCQRGSGLIWPILGFTFMVKGRQGNCGW